jgi:hypothetical protein
VSLSPYRDLFRGDFFNTAQLSALHHSIHFLRKRNAFILSLEKTSKIQYQKPMKTVIVTIQNRPSFVKQLIMACMVTSFLFSCKKEALLPKEQMLSAPVNHADAATVPQLRLSVSRIVLLPGNANNRAVTFNWPAFTGTASETGNYIIEAAASGTQFSDPVEIGAATTLSAAFTVKELNDQMRKMIITGSMQKVEFRVKLKTANAADRYSDRIALDVITYQPYTEYTDAQIFRIPGNFQDWKPAAAPIIVSQKKDGDYEGYINFNKAYSEFLFVKGAGIWHSLTTFYSIGGGKMGFGGDIFSVPEGGSGIYKVNVSTNTNNWSCKKINSWSLYGTAVSSPNNDSQMTTDTASLSWRITTNLNPGEFVLRANKANSIVLGHNTGSATGAVDYNGEKIRITRAGNYTIVLSLQLAGNYAYSVQRNN